MPTKENGYPLEETAPKLGLEVSATYRSWLTKKGHSRSKPEITLNMDRITPLVSRRKNYSVYAYCEKPRRHTRRQTGVRSIEPATNIRRDFHLRRSRSFSTTCVNNTYYEMISSTMVCGIVVIVPSHRS
jgi:hypothetical protein